MDLFLYDRDLRHERVNLKACRKFWLLKILVILSLRF